MKIKFIDEYKSIKSLPDIDLPDFTILTGVNGAGKTHLLEGISNNSIQLEVGGQTVSSLVHFNYQDFIVRMTNTRQQKQPQQTIKQFHNKNKINPELKIVKEKINSLISNLKAGMPPGQRELEIYQFIFHKMFSMNITFLDNSPDIDEVIDFVMEQTQNMEISPQREEIKAIYEQIDSTLENIRQISEDTDLINKYYRISKSIGVHLIRLTENHFKYQESVLGERLMREIVEYRINQVNYDYIKCKNARGKNIHYNNEEESRAINGIPPWELFNQVLNEYSCNGYLICEEIGYPEIFQKSENFQPPIYLINQSTKQVIGVEDLSSGEKTLLALALMIYKQKRGGIFSEVLLLDEVDGNLHPSMIQQLLNVLENIFVNEYGMKIILVTHSPTTIALAPDDSVFTMYRENDNKERIQKQDKETALNILTEGYATLEQGIKLFDSISKKEISIITEGHNTKYLKKANELFGDENKIEVIEGAEDKSGKTQLKAYYDLFSRINHDKKVIFVWDCDAENYKGLGEVNNTAAYVFENNSNNKEIESGIENLFPEDLIKEEFYTEPKKSKDGGKHTLPNKNKMREDLISHGNESDFINFKPFFDWLKTNHLQ